MSKQIGDNKEFRENCKRKAYGVLTAWVNEIRCYYDGSPYSKRDFVLKASHSWGTAYCDWSNLRQELFSKLREVGAVNIIGTVKWNYIDIAFDMKVNKK